MARQYLSLVRGIFIVIFALVILLINFLLKQAVIQPIRPMARLAKKISSDCFDQVEESDIKSLKKAVKSSDKLGRLAQLFKQMVQAISVHEQSFAQQLQKLRAKSEQMKFRTEYKETEIAYLKALQQKAKPLETSQKELTNLVITDNHLLIHSY